MENYVQRYIVALIYHAFLIDHYFSVTSKEHDPALHTLQVAGFQNQFSTLYGVNRLSILDEVPHFDLSLCLPHDIMHVILEGALSRNCKLLLHHCIIDEKYFTLNNLNKIFQDMEYGEHEKSNAPRPIDRDRLTASGDKLGQSGLYSKQLGSYTRTETPITYLKLI